MCRVLRVSRGGFYQWVHHPMSDRDIEDQRLLGAIRDSYVASGGVYDARRVFGDLREAGETCGKHRVEKIMHRHNIQAIRGYKSPRRIVGRPSIVAPNRLERKFTVDTPDQALGHGYHLSAHLAGLALPGGGHRSALAQGGGLVDETDLGPRVSAGCIADGLVAT